MSTRIASVMTGILRSRKGCWSELAVQVRVARIVGVYGHRGVAEHGLGARGGDHDLAAAVLLRDGVRELEQLALRRLVLDLEVREHGAAPRSPSARGACRGR
jgi:hypothetical protein